MAKNKIGISTMQLLIALQIDLVVTKLLASSPAQ